MVNRTDKTAPAAAKITIRAMVQFHPGCALKFRGSRLTLNTELNNRREERSP